MPRASKPTAKVYPKREMIAAAFAATRVRGLPTAQERNNQDLKEAYTGDLKRLFTKFVQGLDLIEAVDYEAAEAAVSALMADRTYRMLQGTIKETPFVHTVHALLNDPAEHVKMTMHYVYLPGMYRSLLSRQVTDEKNAVDQFCSEYIGQVGEVVELEIVVDSVRELKTIDDCLLVSGRVGNNIVSFFVANNVKSKGNRTTTGTYRATIKGHSVNIRNVKETRLTRLTRIRDLVQ